MATIRDVAKTAGVSTATVSYVLNNKPVHPDKEKKVLDAIEKLNYIPNSAARGLRSKKNNTIGLVIPDITNPFYPNLAKGCQDAFKEKGYTLMMYNTDEQQNQIPNIIKQIREGKLDGIILASLVNSDIDNVHELESLNFPTVVAHRKLEECNFDSVVVDNYFGAYKATEHLISLGHTNITFLRDMNGSPVSKDRLNGYIDAMKQLNLTPFVLEGNASYQSGYSITMQLLNKYKGYQQPSAIFASSDIMAYGVLDAVKKMGKLIPDDISIVGFDDLFLSSWETIQLTSVRVPIYEVGYQASNLLLRKMENGNLKTKKNHIVLETELVLRKSCGTL